MINVDEAVLPQEIGASAARPAYLPRPRVLMVGNFLSQTGQGSRCVCEDLVERLTQRNWQVLATSNWRWRTARIMDMVTTVWRQRRNYDLAHVDVFSGRAFVWAEVVCKLLKWVGKPYIVTLRGGRLPDYAQRWPNRVQRLLCDAVSATVPSRFLWDQMRAYRPDLRLLPNPIDVAANPFAHRQTLRPRLVWLRAFHRTYNPAMAAHVLARLIHQYPDAQLTMIGPDKGDGSRREFLRLAKVLGVSRHVRVLGPVPKCQVGQYLSQAEIFLNTTTVDNSPISVVEAMACGLCVVSTDVGGMRYLVNDGQNGLLVPSDDAAAMARAIRRLLKDTELASRLSLNARATAAPRDWSLILPQWEELLSSAASVGSGGAAGLPRIDRRPPPDAAPGAGPHERSAPGAASKRASTPVAEKPPILLIGTFLSRHGLGRSVCEDLAPRLAAAGWPIEQASAAKWRAVRLLDMLKTAWRRRRTYCAAQVDVYSGRAFVWAEATCWLLRRLHKPYVLTLHGGGLPDFAARHPNRVRALLHSAAAITVPSRYLLERMRPYRDDLRLLPNPVNVLVYPFGLRSSVTPRLVWLRSLHAIYNPQLAVRVMARMAGEFPELMLTMIGPDKGDGSLPACRRLAEHLEVADRIEFVGAVPNRDVGSWLNSGDIFLNTTTVDNTPISVIEAMACGLPVVSTNVGGLPFLLSNEEDALLVPSDDPEAMAAAVRRILTEPDLAMRLSRNARAKAETFDWALVLPQWEQLLQTIVQEVRR